MNISPPSRDRRFRNWRTFRSHRFRTADTGPAISTKASGTADVLARHAGAADAAGEDEGELDLASEHLEDARDSLLAARGEAPQDGAADHRRLCSQCQRLQHVGAAPDPAVDEDLDL